MKIAIDGCGDLTRRTILPHLAQPDARHLEVVAVCDIVGERARKVADEFGIAARFSDYETMLRSCDADAVLVVVPPHLHGAHATLAAQSGRHVYVQKPMTTSLQEADALLEAVQENGVKLVAAPGQTLWPLFQQLRALINDGAIGQPYAASAPFIGWGGHEIHHGSDPTWCFSTGSGPLRDHGVYGLQTLTTLLGPVRAVKAFSRINVETRSWNGQEIRVDEADNAALLLDFHNGALGVMSEAWASGSDDSAVFRINGLEGSVQGGARFAGYHGIFPLGCTLRRNGREDRVLEIDPDDVPFLRGEHLHLPNPHIYADISHLAECVLEDREPLANGRQARHTVEILETALSQNDGGAPLSSTF